MPAASASAKIRAPDQGGTVVHAALQAGDGMLMASDDPGAPQPESTYVHWEAEDVEDAHRVFGALAEGRTTEMPIGETFWSPAFGVCRDRWGTLWMVGAPSEFEMPAPS